MRTIIALAVLFLASTVMAQSPPADNQIKAAQYDLDRAAKQSSGVASASKAKQRRFQMMLDSAASQLAASQNQSDPSWLEAEVELQRLQALLEATPQQAETAATSTPQATGAQSSTGPDNYIKSALYALDRAEGQAAGITPSSSAKIRRVTDLMETADADLQKSTTQDDPAWQTAQRRLALLRQRVARDSTAQNSAQPAQPIAEQTAGSEQVAQPADNGAAGTAALDSYDLSLLDSVSRRADSLIVEVQKLSTIDFSEQRIVDKWGRDITQLQSQFGKVSQPQHSQALPVAEKLLALDHYVSQQVAAAQAAADALGDVKTDFAAVEQRARIMTPRAPDKPFSREQLMAYNQKLDALLEIARQDHGYLESIRGKTRVVYESQIDSAVAAVNSRSRDVERERKILADRLLGQFSQPDWFAATVGEAKAQHIDRNRQSIQEAMALVDAVDGFQQSSGMKVMDTAAKREEYNKAIQVLAQRSIENIEQTRFPKIRSNDESLLAAAKEVLSREHYEVNPIERMEITYDVQRKNTAEGNIDWGAAVTTVSVTGYEWDEFAVTTAERVGEDHYLFYNLFKYFHSGGTDVSTGKWVLGERRQGNRILAENISR